MLNIKNFICVLHQQKASLLSMCWSQKIKYNITKQIETKKTKKIVLSKKRNQQLMELKKQLAKKQPIKNQKLYEDYHFRDVYKRINIQMESFFYERPYNLDNFNFLLNLISEQVPADFKDRISEVLHKMSLLNIAPNEKSYNYMIKTAGNSKSIELAEQYFQQACKKFLPNKYFYTSLMQAYVKSNNPGMALKILDQMIEKGLQPDLPTYTTLINCFRIGRKLEKCWELHKKMIQRKIQPDETYTGVMMKVYAATHDAQMAVKLYKENIIQKGIKPMIETVNSYFKALSTRKQYSNIVIDKFLDMAQTGQIVTTQTANWALRACSTTGNIRSASQILKLMKQKNIPISKVSLSSLLKVYSKACQIANLQQQYRQLILTDSWKLLQQLSTTNSVDTGVLNNMLSIYCHSFRPEQVDGLILPLFDKYKQPLNMYTFEILLGMYYKMDDFSTAVRIWKQMQNVIDKNLGNFVTKFESKGQDVAQMEAKINKSNEDIRPTFNAMHTYLDIGIKMLDMKMVLQALDMFKRYKRMPKNQTLKFLGNLKDLPQQIQASLTDFKIQFGAVKVGKKQLPNIKDPQNL